MPELAPAPDTVIERWDRYATTGVGGSVFHRLAWLRAAARTSGTELSPLVLLVEGEQIGIVPVFRGRRGPFRLLLSPSTGAAIPALGPVLTAQLSTREMDRALLALGDALRSYLHAGPRPHIVRMVLNTAITDVRAFQWNGFDATPRYTYSLSLRDSDGENGGRTSFRKQVRVDARRAERYRELAVIDGGRDELRSIVALTKARYRAQGVKWKVTDDYVCELYDALGPEVIQIKAVVRDGVVMTGLVLLRDGNTVRHWLGGAQPRERYIGLNELLHTRVVEEYEHLGCSEYELIGANTRRLCSHKERYGPRPQVYFELEHATALGRAGRWLGNAVRRRNRQHGVRQEE